MSLRDPLVRLLGDLSLADPHTSRLQLSAPWGARIPASGFPGLYVVRHGSAWLRLEDGPSLDLSTGDVVVLPHGSAHALVSTPEMRAPDVEEFCARLGAERMGDVDGGGGGRASDIDTFCFRLESPNVRRLLTVVPQAVVLRGSNGNMWTSHLARALGAMLDAKDPNLEPEIRRIGEVLFATALRDACRSPAGAVADTAVAMALVLVHGDIANPWTASLLARRVGLSRSAFYDRFSRAMGEAPGDYITRTRMEEAARLLRTPGSSVDEVAEAVGYSSRSSFAFAFRRVFGTSPRSRSIHRSEDGS